MSGAASCAIASAKAVGDGERGSAVNLSGFAQIFGEKRGLTDRQAHEKYEQGERHWENEPKRKGQRRYVTPQKRTLATHNPKLLFALNHAQTQP